MGEAKRRSPDPMPPDDRANEAAAQLTKRMVVVGCRGESRSRDPDREAHMNYRVAGDAPSAAQMKDKHAIIFVHGYNVTSLQALESAVHFYRRLQAAQERDGQDLDAFLYVHFSWPGDVGPLWFSDAQKFAQYSGVALYKLVRALNEEHGAGEVSIITHSLGAHVGLRSSAILGERLYSGKTRARIRNVLLLAPAVEDDVFRRPQFLEEYHFPDSPFGMSSLHMFTSRADEVLKNAFFVSELDKALGYAGPSTMSPLKTMSQRVPEVLPGESFRFQLHDFSPKSTTVINPDLHAHHHSDYWNRDSQADYYVNYLA